MKGTSEFTILKHTADIKQKEKVNHPSHYQGNNFEVIDIIEDFHLGFHLGNAIKYILRAGKKDQHQDNYDLDLKKAIWYLEREIEYTNRDANE